MKLRIRTIYRYFSALLLLACIGVGRTPSFAQDGLAEYVSIAGKSLALPANGKQWIDSFRREASGPAIVLIQFQKLPDAKVQKEFVASGIQLLSYLSSNTFLAQVRPVRSTAPTGIRSIVFLPTALKITAPLFPLINSHELVEVLISCVPGQNKTELLSAVRALGGQTIETPLEAHAFYEARVPGDKIRLLAERGDVQSIGPAARDVPLNLESQWVTKVNVAKAPASAGGYNLLGDSIAIGVGDANSGLYHIDTRDRIVNFNNSTYNNHGQHVNGTVGGAGILDPFGEGFAPHVKLIDHLYNRVWERTGAMSTAYNMSVTNNSYSARGAPNAAVFCAYAGTYDAYAQALDSIALLYPNVLHVFAAGNDGTTNCSPYAAGYGNIVGGYQAAKNIIVVSNGRKHLDLNWGSSKGPLLDGRLRPDISAIGSYVHSTIGPDQYKWAIGTSMASPQIAGAAGLLQQHYKRKNAGAYPSAVLTKALMMNPAQDMGRTGPDFMYGYGMLDMRRSLAAIDNGWYQSGTISNGANTTPLTILVPSNTAQLKVMLCWHDAPASPLSTKQLINDIDLKLTDAASTVYMPYVLNHLPARVEDSATRGADHLNNVEQVVIDNPAAGNYTVNLSGYAIPSGSQAYVLTYDLIPKGISISNPFKEGAYEANTLIGVYWNASNDPNTFTIEYSTNNGNTWTILSSSVPALDRYYAWTPPAGTNSNQCMLRITRNVTNEQAVTGSFTVNDQSTLSLSPVQCPGYVNLSWTSVGNVTGYTVYRKIGYYLQPVATTTDTFYNASGLRTDSVYYFTVEPFFGASRGYRSIGVGRRPDTGSCTGSFSNNDLMMDKVLTPTTGRIGTQSALSSSQTLTLLIRNLDDAAASSYKVSYQLNGGSWQSQTLSSLAANSFATVSFTGLSMATAGAYIIRAAIENLTTDGVTTNDTIVKVVKQLQNPVINLSSGTLTEGFEGTTGFTTFEDTLGFTSDERWDYVNQHDTGRMRTYVDNEVTITGSRSISMDMLYYTSWPTLNKLVGTYNLTNYASSDEIRLEFDYKLHGKFKSGDSNRVWVRGSDADAWLPALSYDTSVAAGTTIHTPSLSITDLLNSGAQIFSSATQIGFGQRDTSVIAANAEGSGLTIDNIKVYLVGKDAGLTAVTAPARVNCALTSSTSVSVTVFNGTSVSLSNVGMSYQLDGGTVVSETLSSLGGKASAAFTFAQAMNASAFGAHALKVWTNVSGDDAAINDTLYYEFRNEPLVSTYPYLQTFESNDGYWWTEGTKSSWGWGTPASTTMKKAASGTKAWKTNPTGYYNDNELSYLYSPCFDISALTTPMLSFSLNTQIENCGGTLCDGAWIEYSTNGGTSWTKLGTNGQGTNWYNTSAFQLWNIESPVRWKVASIVLPAASQPMRFRFVFSSDMGANYDGVAIDDIHIFDKTYPLYTGGAVGPITNTVSGSAFTTFTSGSDVLAQISAGNSSSLGSTAVSLYSQSSVPAASMQYYFPKNFVVNTQNAPTDSVTARLFIADADVLSMVNATGCSGCSKPDDAYELGITKYDNSNISLENGTLSDNSGGTYEYIPYARIKWVPYDAGYYAEIKVASFSELWFNDGGPANAFPLPIASVDFDARKSGESSVLSTWLSHIDTQVASYELQRSSDAKSWSKVAVVSPVRDNAHLYTYTDRPSTSTASALYYRLEYTLQDGNIYYSSIKQVIWSGRGAALAVYPNPTPDGKIRLDWSTQPGQTLNATVSDVTGRTVSSINLVANDYSNSTDIDLSGVAKGVYFLHAVVSGERFEVKLVVQ
jgi:hypothetical protein